MLSRKSLALLAAGAIAALAGASAVFPSNAQVRHQVGPISPGVIVAKCDYGFRKTAGRNYTCYRFMRRLCGRGMVASSINIRRVRNRYMISYRCMHGPR